MNFVVLRRTGGILRFDMSKKIQIIGNVTPPGFLDKGWLGEPFYWSVLLVQQNVRSAVYGNSGN